MDKILTFVIVTSFWVAVSSTVGLLMKRSGKPYGVRILAGSAPYYRLIRHDTMRQNDCLTKINLPAG